MNEAPHIYGMHDWDQAWAAIVKSTAKTAWCVVTLEIGDDPNDLSGQDFSHIEAQGITVIGRLNWSHHGKGTIPTRDKYPRFATRCANFVRASRGCTHWVIGNEPNLKGEQPGVPITPFDYANCFKLCRAAIKGVNQVHQVLTAAVAPYNVDSGSWTIYWSDMLTAISLTGGADGITVHTYSRGGGAQSITSEDKMQPPYDAYYNGFRAYRDFLEAVPDKMKGLYVYITETDQNVAWTDVNSGWVLAAYGEIDWWNRQPANQKIRCLVLYRWSKDDQWNISEKRGVVDDFYQTMKGTDYRWPPTALSPFPIEDLVPQAGVIAPSGAQIRKGPGTIYPSLGAVARGTIHKVVGRNTDFTWWQVDTPFGRGWISGTTVSVIYSLGVPIVPITVPIPTVPQTLGRDWVISAWSRVLGIDDKLVRAILAIESGGRSFEDGRMIIRLENHVLFLRLMTLAPSLEGVFDQHFRFGTPSYTGHEYRVNANGPWEKQHDGGQIEEWTVFKYASSIHPTAAMQSISMGSAQIMGFNHGTVGYSRVEDMFNDYNDPSMGEYNQLVGFFAYIVNRKGLLEAVKNKDWEKIAAAYNGTGGVAQYAPMIKNKYYELGGR